MTVRSSCKARSEVENRLADTAPVSEQIQWIAREIPGWTPVDELQSLFSLVYLTADLPGDVMELGSWCGRSAAVLGLAAKFIGRTKVFCFDLFPERKDWRQNHDGSYSFEVELNEKRFAGYRDQTVWEEPFERDVAPVYEKSGGILSLFRENMNKTGVDDVVEVFRGTSADLKRFVPEEFRCKVVFIDADHSYEAVCNDIRNVEPYLVEGGWIGFDDAFTCYEGVDRAVRRHIIENPDYDYCRQLNRKLFVARRRPSRKSEPTV